VQQKDSNRKQDREREAYIFLDGYDWQKLSHIDPGKNVSVKTYDSPKAVMENEPGSYEAGIAKVKLVFEQWELEPAFKEPKSRKRR